MLHLLMPGPLSAERHITNDSHDPLAATHLYCSSLLPWPQLFFGCSCYSTAPDIWAFGCTLGAVLLAGSPPLAPLEEEQERHALAGMGFPACTAAQQHTRHGAYEMERDGNSVIDARIGDSKRQLLAIFDFLGTPTWDEICEMNPELQDAHARMRDWMATPHRPSCMSWRERILRENRHADDRLSTGACSLLAQILQYTPHARPSAATLCHDEFFSMR